MRSGLVFFASLGTGCASLPHSPNLDADPPEQVDLELDCRAIANGVYWATDFLHGSGCPFERDCGLEEYLALPDLAPELRLALTDEELDAELQSILDGEIFPVLAIGPDTLAGLIPEATRLDVLTEGILGRDLALYVVDEGNDYSWRGEWEGHEPDMPYLHLLVTDPLVGTFETVVFRPPLEQGEGPFPAVVVAHGHGDNAWSHAARVPGEPSGGADGFGEQFTAAGYVLVVPTFRISEGDTPETVMTRGLLRAGWSAMAVRMYEQLLARRIAAALPFVDPCSPVGLVGHSGGSISSALTVRSPLAPLTFDAWVTDLDSTYLNWDPVEGWTLDETTPALWPYRGFINDLDTAPLPAMRTEYGYPEGIDPQVDFFDDTLRRVP